MTKLKATSLVDKTYVSVLFSRSRNVGDLEIDFAISQVEGVDGTTQGGSVSLVVLNFAGLTTNVKDLKVLLLAIPNIKNIIINRLPQKHLVEILIPNGRCPFGANWPTSCGS
ncbi:hypothetical protein BDC45DRAFT_583410 [Circinella umbellata]|nr:hypothetical protein BDC45DRAFT_583410 [Circinella umbellata]